MGVLYHFLKPKIILRFFLILPQMIVTEYKGTDEQFGSLLFLFYVWEIYISWSSYWTVKLNHNSPCDSTLAGHLVTYDFNSHICYIDAYNFMFTFYVYVL